MRTYLLNNGCRIPAIGLGSSIVPKNKSPQTEALAKRQMDIYEYAMNRYPGLLYDTSSSYGKNEEILGQAIKNGGMRSKIFLVVKISNHEQRQGNIRQAVETHLKILNTDYVDMLMLHWPHPGTFLRSWKTLEQLYSEGYASSLGVSNFHQHHLQQLLEYANIIPAVNQIEIHPLFTQAPLIAWCRKLNIRPMAYSPLGRMHDVLIKAKILRDLAKKYNKTVPQIILRWNIMKGLITIPRTCTPRHLDEFMSIFTFKLTDQEVGAINSLNENIRLRYNPDTVDYTIV